MCGVRPFELGGVNSWVPDVSLRRQSMTYKLTVRMRSLLKANGKRLEHK